jgi:hypothetical protein
LVNDPNRKRSTRCAECSENITTAANKNPIPPIAKARPGRRRHRLGLETGNGFVPGKGPVEEELDRHLASEPDLTGPVNHARPTPSQLLHQLEAPEQPWTVAARHKEPIHSLIH